MDLKIEDVSALLNVPESTIRDLLTTGKIPGYCINNQYRFSRVEIEDWIMRQKVAENKDLIAFDFNDDGAATKNGSKQFGLYRALHKGAVLVDLRGDTKEEVICNTMYAIADTLSVDPEAITNLLLDRERLHPTALNNGFAVPHTRDFLLKAHHDVVVVVFPEKPIPYGALDGKLVHTLFFLFACEDKRHLNLLAKIAHLSHQPQAVELLRSKPPKDGLLSYVKEWESAIGT